MVPGNFDGQVLYLIPSVVDTRTIERKLHSACKRQGYEGSLLQRDIHNDTTTRNTPSSNLWFLNVRKIQQYGC